MKLFRAMLFCLVAFSFSAPSFGQVFVNLDRPAIALGSIGSQPDAPQEVAESTSTFHRSVIQAAVKLSREPNSGFTRRDLIKLRVAMLSPAFRDKAQELALVQMSFSGEEDAAVPLNENGEIDETAINWEGLGNFMKVFIPLLLELLKAFGGLGG